MYYILAPKYARTLHADFSFLPVFGVSVTSICI